MKKTFVIWEVIDGHKYLNGVIECTEEQVKSYCKGKTAESELDAYSMDEDDPFYDPFPYTSSFEYQEVERLQLAG
jgi:hypothetical protein